MRLLEGGFLLTAKCCVRLWRLTVSGDGEGGTLISLALIGRWSIVQYEEHIVFEDEELFILI